MATANYSKVAILDALRAKKAEILAKAEEAEEAYQAELLAWERDAIATLETAGLLVKALRTLGYPMANEGMVRRTLQALERRPPQDDLEDVIAKLQEPLNAE